jgi:hypothetical protein
MGIQLSIFLIVFIVFLLIVLFFTFFNLFHILHYAFAGFWAYAITFTYLASVILALVVTFYFMMQIDWSQTLYLLQATSNLI